MRYLFLVLLAATLCLCSCKKKDINSTPAASTERQLITDASVKPDSVASFSIAGASISGNILTVQVSYSGGCKEHSFDLYFNGMYAKSMPPQARLFLKHTSEPDNCRELVMRDLKFDISSLRKNNATVVVLIGDQRLTYSAN